jgi:mRNA interferase HigB
LLPFWELLYIMRIISEKALKDCWEKHATAEGPLKAWRHDVRTSTWDTPQKVKDHFGGNVDILGNNRAVFDIKGNTFRIVAHINYSVGIVYIRFIGTHSEYDKIDAKTI